MNRTFVSNNYLFTLPKKRVKTLTQIVSTVTIYFTLLILTYSNFINAQFSSENKIDIRIGGLLGGNTLSIPILVIVAFLIDRDFRKLIFGKIGITYVIVISVCFLIGLLVNNELSYINIDLINVFWLVAGCAMFYIVSNSYNPKIQLFFVVLFPTALMLYSFLLQADRISTNEITRVLFGEINYTFSLSLITSLAIAVFSRKSLFWTLSIWALVAIHLFIVAASGFRSFGLTLITVIIFSVFVLSYKLSQGLLHNAPSAFQPKNLILMLVFLSLCLLLFVFSDFLVQLIDSFTNLSIIHRFASKDGQRSSELRILDIFNMFQNLQGIPLISGKGIGATYPFYDPYGGFDGYVVWFTHFGILTYWLKGGIILFSAAVFYFYIKLPKLFIKSLIKPRAFDPRERTALLTILPGVFGYVVCMSINAVFVNYHSFWGLGFLFGAYLHIRKYGLGIFLE